LVTTSENELKQLIIEYAHCLKIKKIWRHRLKTRTLHLSKPYNSRSATHTARQPRKKYNHPGSTFHSSATSGMAKYASICCGVEFDINCPAWVCHFLLLVCEAFESGSLLFVGDVFFHWSWPPCISDRLFMSVHFY
jgi:hypothetical protein